MMAMTGIGLGLPVGRRGARGHGIIVREVVVDAERNGHAGKCSLFW